MKAKKIRIKVPKDPGLTKKLLDPILDARLQSTWLPSMSISSLLIKISDMMLDKTTKLEKNGKLANEDVVELLEQVYVLAAYSLTKQSLEQEEQTLF